MKSKHALVLTSLSIAIAALVAACGGGGGDGPRVSFPPIAAGVPASAPDVPVVPTAPPELAECLVLPEQGKDIAVSIAGFVGVPVTLGVATLTYEGDQTFEGRSYPTLKVRSQLERLSGRESRHAVHLLPEAPYLPAGATSFASTEGHPNKRYAYTYANLTLEQLNKAVTDGNASFSWGAMGSPDTWEWTKYVSPEAASSYARSAGELSFPNLKVATPSAADFAAGPVTLLLLERQGYDIAPLPSLYSFKVSEVKLTNAGHEDVAVGDTPYPQACKLDIQVRRANIYDYSKDPSVVETREASAWFARGKGIVKVELKEKKSS